MTRFVKIPEYEDFFKALKQTLNNYAIEIGVSVYEYFADKVFIESQNRRVVFSNLLNPGTGKDLKVRELLLLLDNCPEHQKPLLDYLCNRYDLICSLKAYNDSKTTEYENIKDLLIGIAGSNGSIFNDYLDYISDDELDNDEIKSLIKTSYQTRALLNQFEEDLRKRLRDDL